MSEQNKKDFKEIIPKIILIIIGVLAAIFLYMLLFSQKRTMESSKKSDNESISSISCTAKSIGEHPIYYSDKALTSDYEIRGIFNGDQLRNITLDYISKYANKDAAKSSQFWIQAHYNFKWQDWGFGSDPLQANYTVLEDNTVITRVYADYNQLTERTASLMLITANNGNVPSSSKDIKSNYEKLGFTCTIKENQ